MKTIPIALESHIQQEVTTICTCWKVTLADTTVYGFTDSVKDLVIDGLTYQAASGYTPSAVQNSLGLSVDNLEVQGLLDSSVITSSDLLGGKWDKAEIEIFQVNYNDLTQGKLYLSRGWLGVVDHGKVGFVGELRGLTAAYQQIIGKVYKSACDADLGDTRCGVNLATYTFTGSITSVTSNRDFNDSSRAEAANYYQGGKITFTSGLNNGLSMEVKSSNGANIVLQLAMPFNVAVGDTYSISAGCNKIGRNGDCTNKFSNYSRFRGFEDVPNNDRLMSRQ